MIIVWKYSYRENMSNPVIHKCHHLSPPSPQLPFSHLLLSRVTEKQLSPSSSSSILVTPRLLVCMCVTPQQRPESVSCRVGWRAKVMKHSLADILGQWSISAAQPAPSGWVSVFSSSQSAEQPARNKQPPNSPSAPDAWTTHQHPLPSEMGNMVLRKVENWEACQAVCPLVRAGTQTEMEFIA